MYLMYAKYQVDTWILNYSNIRQLQLLKYAKSHPKFVFGFVVSLLSLLIVTLVLVSYFRRERYSNEILQLINPLIRKLEKNGFRRRTDETIHKYFVRYKNEIRNEEEVLLIQKIDLLYEKIIYGNDTSSIHKQELQRLIAKIKKL